MRLDHDRCYEAIASRDGRFDGRFFTAVRTTGIYCRPVCPSRTPKRTNVAFFVHPAAAEDAGFRPCRRCRPETAPGSPEWNGADTVVERALRLIDEGVLDESSVDQLAARLHVGGRHLRRLFADRLGTSPDAVARTRRAHLAKRLVLETDLKMADIAFAAGFGSVRQCNDVVRRTFDQTPTQLRGGRMHTVPSGLRLRLPVRQPFDADLLLDWFRARAVDGMEAVTESTYERRISVDGVVGTVRLEPQRDHVELAVDLPAGTALAELVGGCRRLFDLDCDPVAVDAHLSSDPALAPLVAARPGIRVPGCWTGFEAAVRAVVGQQVSVAAATTIVGRIAAAHGSGGAFPGPERMVDAPLEQLGVIGSRSETIRTIARGVVAGDLALDGSLDVAELTASLLAVKGIGPWSASYIALRTGEPDAFPAGDLHLRRMLEVDNDRDANARADAWRPWRAYAAMHLWQQPAPEAT